MHTYTSTLAFLVVARRFTAEDWEYNLQYLDTRACELGGQACKNLREKIAKWRSLLFPERVTARKYGRGFSFSLAALTGIAEYLKTDTPDKWRGLSFHRMCESLFEFYKTAIRRAQQDPDAAMESLRKAEPPPQKSLITTFKEIRAAKIAQEAQATQSQPNPPPASPLPAPHTAPITATPVTEAPLRRKPANEEERAALRQSLAALNPFAV